MTKELKLTPWYPGNVKPVRKGVYQRRYGRGALHKYCYWDGRIFGFGSLDKETAKDSYDSFGPSAYKNALWRGVAK